MDNVARPMAGQQGRTTPGPFDHADCPTLGRVAGGDRVRRRRHRHRYRHRRVVLRRPRRRSGGQYCRTSVTSERKAVRDIKTAVPGDLVEKTATSGPAIRECLHNLMDNWRTKGASMVQDSWGEEVTHPFTVDRLDTGQGVPGGHKEAPSPTAAHLHRRITRSDTIPATSTGSLSNGSWMEAPPSHTSRSARSARCCGRNSAGRNGVGRPMTSGTTQRPAARRQPAVTANPAVYRWSGQPPLRLR